MAELVANFTISEGVEFDTVFQIDATPTKVSQLDNDLNYQTDEQVAESIDEAATTINNRIDDVVDAFDSDIETINGQIDTINNTVSDNYTTLDNKINNNTNDITGINNTLQSYGNIVTHNVSEFATSAQGALADSALQPNDNITELVNNAEYITTSSVGKANLTIQRNGSGIGTFNANATEPLTVNISVPTTASDINAVPTSRKINGHTLTADVTLTAADVGALPSTTTINDLTTTAQQNALNSGATTTNIGQIATNTSAISTINGKIPSQASSSNQLADKSFVNSSIATNTANFIGTFNSVAELEAYSGTLTNNDYAFVVTTDSAGNTLYDRYKYNGSEWLFEYELNNSSFTASQWSAINSGITSSDVTLIGTALQPNDNISELTNNAGYITSSALTPYVLSSSLATVATSGSYNDLSNKPTIPSEVTESTVSGWGFTKNTGTVTSVNNVSPVNGNVTLSIPTVDSALSTTSENPVQNKVITNSLNDKANDSDVIKKSGGSTSQTISLSSGTGTTALGVKSASTSSSYISFTSASAWLGSIGVNSSKQPVFYNGIGYTLAYTSDIPTIATSVSASSTNSQTVGAKLFYDTCGDIETLINAL